MDITTVFKFTAANLFTLKNFMADGFSHKAEALTR